MNLPSNKRRVIFPLVVVALFVLCGTLGVLQYMWIGEVSAMARERLRGSLEASLSRISQDFNTELTNACLALLPPEPLDNVAQADTEISTQYEQAKRAGARTQTFERVSLAVPEGGKLALRTLDERTGKFAAAEWPEQWSALRRHLEMRMASARMREGESEHRPPMGPPEFVTMQGSGGSLPDDPFVVEMPVFDRPGDAGSGAQRGMREPAAREMRRAPAGGPFRGREAAWLLLKPNVAYIGSTVLPELIQADLGRDYQAEVAGKNNGAVVYPADAKMQAAGIAD